MSQPTPEQPAPGTPPPRSMFNATLLRERARVKTRLDSYFKRNGFKAILAGLVKDEVPEVEIMTTTRGPGGCTMLNDAFFIDFMAWVGGEPYYKAVKKFVQFNRMQ
jgi:hypothetical protein